jgi:hypothetical protein
MWLRSQIGDQYRATTSTPRQIVLTIGSWASAAILALPLCIGVAAASPLSHAVLCSAPTDTTSYNLAGDFVGETKERVYLGAEGRIVSVPATKITRLTIGHDATDPKLCEP